jgi:hypothetical protein
MVSGKFFIPENNLNNTLLISAFNFLLSWAAYHILRHDKKRYESSYIYRRYFFIVLFILVGAGFSIGQELYFAFNNNQILNYVFSFLLVILYGIKSTGLRQHLVVRYLTIVLVWFSVTGLIFILSEEKLNSLAELTIFSLSRSLLFFICILPFDLMDKESDRMENTTTLAHRLSEKKMYALIGIVMSMLILISNREMFSWLVVAFMMTITLWLSKKSIVSGKLLAESILAVEGINNLLIG